MSFHEVARLHEWSRDIHGNFEDIVLLELPLSHYRPWWTY